MVSPCAECSDEAQFPSAMTARPECWFVTMLQPERGAMDWERDGGLLCLGFRANGMDSKFVALGETAVHHDEPRINASLEQLSDPEWWRQWGIAGVVLY